MIRINVAIQVKSENRQKVLLLLNELAEKSRIENGCRGYDIYENSSNREALMIVETWENAEVLSAHRHTEHFTRLVPMYHGLVEANCIDKFTDEPSVSQAILNRRSVRDFLPDKIDKDTLQRIVKAAMYAPSANNRRPWEFLIVEDREHLEALSRTSPYGLPINRAPLAIVVCCNTQNAGLDGVFWPQDLGACIENMMLQAYGEGLGSVWMGYYPRMDRVHEVKICLSLPKKLVPFAIVAIGKPTHENTAMPERFEFEKIHFLAHE